MGDWTGIANVAAGIAVLVTYTLLVRMISRMEHKLETIGADVSKLQEAVFSHDDSTEDRPRPAHWTSESDFARRVKAAVKAEMATVPFPRDAKGA